MSEQTVQIQIRLLLIENILNICVVLKSFLNTALKSNFNNTGGAVRKRCRPQIILPIAKHRRLILVELSKYH